jgi:hypothetical protein
LSSLTIMRWSGADCAGCWNRRQILRVVARLAMWEERCA